MDDKPTALIRLTGVHAIGEAEYAKVDADMFPYLSQWRWKAKPNGGRNNVYAVRNSRDEDGKCITIRMHRLVTGYHGPLDVDHINHVGVDNRRENLRVVTRRENLFNLRPGSLLFGNRDLTAGVLPGVCN